MILMHGCNYRLSMIIMMLIMMLACNPLFHDNNDDIDVTSE